MSANTRQLLAFVVFICAWSLLALGALGLHVQVVAVFAVWLVGFIWGVGYIAADMSEADLLLKRWFQMMVGIAALGGLLALVLS